jgi:hypothetical protein
MPELAAHIAAGDYAIDAVSVPLRDVESTWTAPRGGDRIVFTP